MRVLDLDPLVLARREEIAAGEHGEHDRYVARAADFDQARWTGPDGVVNEMNIATVEAVEYTPIVHGRV